MTTHETSGMAWGDRHGDTRNDWQRPAHAFRTLDGQPVMAERRKYTAADVGRAYTDGVRNGFIAAMVVYGVGSLVLVLAFHALGVK